MPDSLTSGVHVRADNEPYFFFVKGWCDEKYPAHHETFYQTMDCTGRKLVFRQANAVRAYITHVKLVPRRRRYRRLPPATKQTLGLSCTFHDYYFLRPTPRRGHLRGRRQITRVVWIDRTRLLLRPQCLDLRDEGRHPAQARGQCDHEPGLLAKCGRGNNARSARQSPRRRTGTIKLSGRLSMNCHYHGSYENALTSQFVLDHVAHARAAPRRLRRQPPHVLRISGSACRTGRHPPRNGRNSDVTTSSSIAAATCR